MHPDVNASNACPEIYSRKLSHSVLVIWVTPLLLLLIRSLHLAQYRRALRFGLDLLRATQARIERSDLLVRHDLSGIEPQNLQTRHACSSGESNIRLTLFEHTAEINAHAFQCLTLRFVNR